VVECSGDRPCPLSTACRLRRILADAQEVFYRELDNYLLSDLVTPMTIELLHLPALSATDAAPWFAGAAERAGTA
jgi:Rrf2 family transcriptional regulator, nitric oxide-sensitive transcriptional repressor